jgi:Asp-tRNA(Asn)/Glu-tRNA(Gln) amidotransferase A subunit family amidase
MTNDTSMLTATQASTAIRTGALSVERLARDCLDRVAERNDVVQAWAYLDPDAVIAAARELDRSPVRGPLHGLPIGVKDVIHTRDMATRHNSSLYAEAGPSPDAACVAILRSAGALIFGKTTTVEFAAIGRPPATQNPHDPARTPGGSSSGSAAAVADGQAPLALGTQTGGSMIRPASFCGVWAMKPTWGRVSNEGCKRFSSILDTLGWYGRCAEDLALMLCVLDASPPSRCVIPNPSTLRIAACKTPMWHRAEPETQAAFFAAIDTLNTAGVEISFIDGSDILAPLHDYQSTIMRADGRVAFKSELRPDGSGLEGAMAAMANGQDVASHATYLEAFDGAAAARTAFDRLAAPFDAVLVPSAPGEAPEGLASTGDYIFNGTWTLLHTPCVNVPGWAGPHGMPVGLTLTGSRFSDWRVLGVAQALEAVGMGANLRRP